MSGLAATVQLGQTSKFSVLDLAGSKVKHVTLSISKQEGEVTFLVDRFLSL